ncbi:MAG TPA: hypothetical protein VIU64_08830 [Polyangia bacterium]
MTKLRGSLAKIVAAGLGSAALLVTSAAARAEEPPPPAPMATSSDGGGGLNVSSAPFGAARQMAFVMMDSGDFPFKYAKSGGGNWQLHFRPALDYFVQQNVSVGGHVGVDTGGGYSTVDIGVRAGYHVALSELVSLWPLGGLSFSHTSENNGPSASVTRLDINVPFLFHLVPHFLLGVGPFFSLPLTNSQAMGNKDPSYGLTALVGGYF